MIRDDRHQEEGAVAVVVALVLALVLLPVAAFALDLGNGYTLASALQRAANAAATAGAQELARQQRGDTPGESDAATAMSAARAAAIDVLCNDPVLRPRGPGTAGFASTACPGPDPGWASDGDADPADPARHPNGEIQFFSGPVDEASHAFGAGQLVDPAATNGLVTGIRVVTPPATVPYAVAPILGIESGTRQAHATAQVLTVLPARDWNGTSGVNLQLYLTQADLATTPGRKVAWCARSAPRESWDTGGDVESRHPTGVCDVALSPALYPWVPRGYLTAPSSARQRYAVGSTVQLQDQRWPTVARIRELRPGLLDAGGRLARSGCPGGNSASSGGYGGLEAAYLSDFAGNGSVTELKDLLLSGAPPTPEQAGMLSPDILRCGRLAVLPVLATAPASGGVPAPFVTSTTGAYHYGLSTTTYRIAALRLAWIDNAFTEGDLTPIATSTPNPACLQRGFYWENPNSAGWCPARDEANAYLRAITGYVIDPRLLPATVSGEAAANVTDYIGSGLPATVRMVRDLGDPPAS